MDEKEYREYMLAEKIFAGLFIGAAGCASIYGLYIIGKAIYGCFAKTSEARVVPIFSPDVDGMSVASISSETDSSVSYDPNIQTSGDNIDSSEIV